MYDRKLWQILLTELFPFWPYFSTTKHWLPILFTTKWPWWPIILCVRRVSEKKSGVLIRARDSDSCPARDDACWAEGRRAARPLLTFGKKPHFCSKWRPLTQDKQSNFFPGQDTAVITSQLHPGAGTPLHPAHDLSHTLQQELCPGDNISWDKGLDVNCKLSTLNPEGLSLVATGNLAELDHFGFGWLVSCLCKIRKCSHPRNLTHDIWN